MRPITRVFLPVFLILLALTGLALADDQVGIYFDQDFTQNTIDSPAGSVVTGYLVLKDPSVPEGVAGWELCVDLDGPGLFMTWDVQGQNINVQTPPCFVVGIGNPPLPGGDNVLLASFTLLVQEALPVALSVGPTYPASLPNQMSWLTNTDPGVILPLTPVTGQPEVAWINPTAPGAEVTPDHIFFGEIPLGHQATADVSIHNPGGGPLFLDIHLVGGCDGFSLSAGGGSTMVPAGGTTNLTVQFEPPGLGYFECALDLGNPIAGVVQMNGSGREPVISWEVPSVLDFGVVNLGGDRALSLPVTNTGEAPFVIDPQLQAGCAEFTVIQAGAWTINPGVTHPVLLRFSPLEPGPVSCELDLGEVVPPVTLTGIGHELVQSFELNPTALNFPDVPVTGSLQRSVELSNTGETYLDLDVHLVESGPPFSIIFGGGVTNLEPGDSRHVVVEFSPDAVGQFTNELSFGNPDLPLVPITGAGVEPETSCFVSPQELNFGIIPQGAVFSMSFSVLNSGDLPLEVVPGSSCPGIVDILPHSVLLQPGDSQDFQVQYFAQELGPFECLVTLGEASCSDVLCLGVVEEAPDPQDNLVGLFFDEGYFEFETQVFTPGTLVPTYLVLVNPSDDTGVRGWECRLQIEGGDVIQLETEFAGQALNVATPPEYVVGLGTPLPWASRIRLATFNLMVMSVDEETFLHLLPVNSPSIPGEMAWLTEGTVDEPGYLLPMRPYTGMSVVALINANVLAVEAPAPQVAMNGGLVQLDWDVPQGSEQSYLVYRRGESGPAELLFSQPINGQDGHFSYQDNPVGFAAGTTLHYSYAVIVDGQETARSPETDIRLSGLPLPTTRLLPNIPNPFNPMTEINFELRQPGPVRVSIYDVSGHLVRVLVDGYLESGHYTRQWQGKDLQGRQVPSGAYYLRLETADRVDHRKMMLLK